jgi:hypothetical protein
MLSRRTRTLREDAFVEEVRWFEGANLADMGKNRTAQ